MGLLTEGQALTWDEIISKRDYIRQIGIDQFIYLYNRFKGRQNDCFTWGEEVEFTLVRFDHEKKRVQVSLKAHDLLPILNEQNQNYYKNEYRVTWHPEGCDFVLEGVPNKPYGYLPIHFNTVEANMKLRRSQVQSLLEENEYILNICAFPRMGSPKFTYPEIVSNPLDNIGLSIYMPNEVISPMHPRY
ncbi:unnamed protein product, partial [Didymodactylos carnosus]